MSISSIKHETLLTKDEERTISNLLRLAGLDALPIESVEYDDTLHSLDENNPSNEISKEQMLRHLRIEVDKLDEKYRQVISWYFGLTDGISKSLAEITELCGYKSRNSIQDIVKRGLQQLKIGMKSRGH